MHADVIHEEGPYSQAQGCLSALSEGTFSLLASLGRLEIAIGTASHQVQLPHLDLLPCLLYLNTRRCP